MQYWNILAKAVGWRNFVFTVVLFLLCGYARAGYLTPVYTIAQSVDLVYFHDTVSGQDLLLDAYVPQENSNADKPAIVMFHGNTMTKEIMGVLAEPLTQRGFVCFTVNWQTTPDYTENIIRAVQWVRANAASYGVSPDRISALGHSYGASMTGILAVSDSSPADAKINAAVMLAGRIFYPEQCQSTDTPTMIIHGRQDNVVEFYNATESIAALKQAGMRYAFFPVDGLDHYRIMMPGTQVAYGRSIVEIISEFLACYLIGVEESTMAPLYATAPYGSGTVDFQPLNGFYPKGTRVSVSAMPEPGLSFFWWKGDIVSADNPVELDISTSISMEAVIPSSETPLYHLNASAQGPGEITLSPPGGLYPAGEVVSVTASSVPGFPPRKFSYWGGDATGTAAEVQVIMDKDKEVVAVFSNEAEQVPVLSVYGLALLAAVLGGAGRLAMKKV